MTDLIVRENLLQQQKETQSKAAQVLASLIPADDGSDDGLFAGAVCKQRTDWFTQTELYRLGLRRKRGDK